MQYERRVQEIRFAGFSMYVYQEKTHVYLYKISTIGTFRGLLFLVNEIPTYLNKG